MKPDWQNKSFAKTSSPTSPSTTHPKLKIGMSSLHSKIAVANHNTVQAKKPAVRKFADGGAVMTRSDDEIGDTNPRTGKVDPGSYDRRMAQGEKNLQALKDAFNKFTGDKATTQNVSSDTNAEYKAGGESDAAKAKIISAAMDKKPETVITEEPRRQISDYMVKKNTEEVKTDAAPIQAPAPAKAPAPVAVTESAKPVVKKPAAKKPAAKKEVKTEVKPVSKGYDDKGMLDSSSNSASNLQDSSRSMPAPPAQLKETDAQMREKQLRASGGARGARMREAATDTGDEMARLRDKTTKTIPGVVGRFDLQGNQVPVGLGPRSSQVYSGGYSSPTSVEKRYLQSRIDAGNLTTMEKAQAKRAGLI